MFLMCIKSIFNFLGKKKTILQLWKKSIHDNITYDLSYRSQTNIYLDEIFLWNLLKTITIMIGAINESYQKVKQEYIQIYFYRVEVTFYRNNIYQKIPDHNKHLEHVMIFLLSFLIICNSSQVLHEEIILPHFEENISGNYISYEGQQTFRCCEIFVVYKNLIIRYL